jgi:hypothetical protein
MGDERNHLWEPDELREVLATYHLKFEEQHKLLDEAQARWAVTPVPTFVWEPSAASKEAGARLKALQEYIRNLPPRP